MHGEYDLLKLYKNHAIFKFSAYNELPTIYSVSFKNLDCSNISDLMNQENIIVTPIEQLKFNQSEIETEIAETIKTFKKDTISLENGAEAYFVRSTSLDSSKRHPMIAIIHGGPFGCAP